MPAGATAPLARAGAGAATRRERQREQLEHKRPQQAAHDGRPEPLTGDVARPRDQEHAGGQPAAILDRRFEAIHPWPIGRTSLTLSQGYPTPASLAWRGAGAVERARLEIAQRGSFEVESLPLRSDPRQTSESQIRLTVPRSHH
jgi:hypothetical protein